MLKQIEERKKVAIIIQRILEGSLSPEEALKIWPEYADDTSINAVRHAIEHFIADEDIQKKDKNYEEHQIQQLKRFKGRLAEGKSLDEKEIGWFTPRYFDPMIILKKILKKVKGI